MSRDIVNAICAGFPGAENSDPWGGGHDAWKVGGKMFACIGAVNEAVAVKCPDIETAEMLIEAGEGLKARYFHRSWLLLPYEGMGEAAVAHRLAVSYDAVRAGLPKSVRAALPPTVPRRTD